MKRWTFGVTALGMVSFLFLCVFYCVACYMPPERTYIILPEGRVEAQSSTSADENPGASLPVFDNHSSSPYSSPSVHAVLPVTCLSSARSSSIGFGPSSTSRAT